MDEGREVMEGGFQSSLWLFAFNGYCVFEDVVCTNPSGVLDGSLTMQTSLFQGSLLGLAQVGLRLLTRGLIMRLAFFQGSTLGLGSPLCWCFLEVQRLRCKAGIRRAFDRSASVSSFSSTFSSSFHLFLCFFAISLA